MSTPQNPQNPLIPVVQPAYKPATDTPGAAHYTLSTAFDTDPERPINGEFVFRYPDAFTQVQIGARIAELINYGRSTPIALEQLPPAASMRAEAIATLEFVLVTAPRGWYVEGANHRPQLAPGLIGGDGNDDAILEVFSGYWEWRKRFRDALEQSRKPEGA